MSFYFRLKTKNYVPFTNGSCYLGVCVERSPCWPMLGTKNHFLPACVRHINDYDLFFGGKSICPILTHWRIRLKPENFHRARRRKCFSVIFCATPEHGWWCYTEKPKRAMLERLGASVQLRSSIGNKKSCSRAQIEFSSCSLVFYVWTEIVFESFFWSSKNKNIKVSRAHSPVVLVFYFSFPSLSSR